MNTANNRVSNSNIIIKYHFMSWEMDVQLDKIVIGIIKVVNNTK